MKKKEDIVSIPFVAHESAMNRMERANKRLTTISIIELFIILIIFISIMVYFYLPTEAIEDTQTIDNIQNSEINQNMGE